MKRTLTSIAAASMILGMTVPAAFASTSGPNYNQRTISIGSYSAGLKGIAAKDPWSGANTEFMPIFYLQQGLKALGYTATWDGMTHTLAITTPSGSTTGLTKVTPGNGTVITVNGVPIVNAPKTLVAKDPASGKWTSYLPIYYLADALKALGYTSSYNGAAGTWTVASAVKLAVTGAPTGNVAVGAGESLGVTNNGTAVTSGVTWSVSGTGAVIDQMGNFVASQPGTYTVTASYEGQTATATITVYGAAAGVKLAAAAPSVVANNASTDTLTATIVDANGNTVSNYTGTGTIDLTSGSGTSIVTTLANQPSDVTAASATTATVNFTNGQATVNVIAGNVPNLTSTYTGSFTPTGGTPQTATTTVSTVAQKATSIKLTAPSTIGTNAGTETASVTAQVEDQTGNPMLSGVYPLTFNISGSSATFDVGGTATTTAQTGTVVANGTAGVELQSVKGNLGTTTVTVTGAGLTSAVANITGVSVGNAAKLGLAVDPNSSASFAQGTNATLDASVLDAAGNTLSNTSVPSSVYVVVTDASGNPTTNLTVNTHAVNSSGEIQIPTGSTFTIGTTTASGVAAAGTYNVQLVDTATSGALTSSPVVQVTVTPAAADKITLTPAQAYEAASSTTDQFTAQVVDQYGNPVADGGVPLQFYATRPSGTLGTATLNGVTQDGTSATAVVYGTTNSSGQYTVTLDPQSYTNTWTVYATPSGLPVTTPATATENVVPTLTQKVGVTLSDATTGSSYVGTTTFSAGDSVTLQLSQLDQYGNPIVSSENDTMAVTFSNASSIMGLPSTSTSSYSVTMSGNSETITGTESALNTAFSGLTAGIAGPFSVTAVDKSVSSAQTGMASGDVLANSLASQIEAVLPSTGMTVSSTGEVGPITIQLVDAGGNPAPLGTNYTLTYSELQTLLGGNGGSSTVTFGAYGFRTSANGADNTSATIAAGTTSIQVWVYSTPGTIYASNPQVAH